MITRSICALTAVLLLAACGGGGGGGGPTAGTPDAPSDPPFGNTPPADEAELLAAAGPALYSLVPTSKVWFGSASVSAGPDVTGIGSSFDGQRATVTVERGSADTVHLGTTSGELYNYSVFDPTHSGLSANRTHRETYFFDRTSNRVTYGRFVVDWSSGDRADYAVGGYWLHAGPNSTDWEVGGFAHGPELSLTDPATLPASGTATYHGEGGGMVSYEVDGTRDSSHFDGHATLTADFSAGTIGGRFNTLGLEVEFGTVAFDRDDGTFQGTNVTIPGMARSSGKWAGQFSNIPDSSGAPRLLAGVFDGTALSNAGDTFAYVGAFGAGRNQ